MAKCNQLTPLSFKGLNPTVTSQLANYRLLMSFWEEICLLVKWSAMNKLDRGPLDTAMVTLMVNLLTNRHSAVNPVSNLKWVNPTKVSYVSTPLCAFWLNFPTKFFGIWHTEASLNSKDALFSIQKVNAQKIETPSIYRYLDLFI